MWTRTLALHLSLCLLLVALSSATKKPPPQPINTADSTQLQLVPGIGPSTAEKILQMRKSYGAFKNVNELMAIRRSRPKAPRKNEEISDRRQALIRSPKHPSTRQLLGMRKTETPRPNQIHTCKIRRYTKRTAPATVDRAACSRNRRTLAII
jgi:Helix-hairpin-helix motif